MSDTSFQRLEDVILHDAFPDVDLALRRGRHVDRDDAQWYEFLVDAQVHLEEFYRRFGCELLRKTDGYFYLLPTSDRLGKRQLSVPEMLVGQTLTLLLLDPATIDSGGVVTRADVLSHLSSVVGADTLIRLLNPKKRRYDERVAHETVRSRVGEALRRLSTLGFIDFVDDDRVRLRSSLMRFAEPVRGAAAPAEALQKLVASGEVVLSAGEDGGDDADDPDFPGEIADGLATAQGDEHDAPDIDRDTPDTEGDASTAAGKVAPAAQDTPDHERDVRRDAGGGMPEVDDEEASNASDLLDEELAALAGSADFDPSTWDDEPPDPDPEEKPE